MVKVLVQNSQRTIVLPLLLNHFVSKHSYLLVTDTNVLDSVLAENTDGYCSIKVCYYSYRDCLLVSLGNPFTLCYLLQSA
jgi:hypothetical protein